MTLKEWFEKTGVKQIWLARKLGVSKTYITFLVKGQAMPSEKRMEQIEDATEGAVTASSWREVAK